MGVLFTCSCRGALGSLASRLVTSSQGVCITQMGCPRKGQHHRVLALVHTLALPQSGAWTSLGHMPCRWPTPKGACAGAHAGRHRLDALSVCVKVGWLVGTVGISEACWLKS